MRPSREKTDRFRSEIVGPPLAGVPQTPANTSPGPLVRFDPTRGAIVIVVGPHLACVPLSRTRRQPQSRCARKVRPYGGGVFVPPRLFAALRLGLKKADIQSQYGISNAGFSAVGRISSPFINRLPMHGGIMTIVSGSQSCWRNQEIFRDEQETCTQLRGYAQDNSSAKTLRTTGYASGTGLRH